MADERKVAYAYTVVHYDSGDIDVQNAEGFEGATALDTETIYHDIEETARIIDLKKYENACVTGTLRAFRIMREQARRDAEEEVAALSGAEPAEANPTVDPAE